MHYIFKEESLDLVQNDSVKDKSDRLVGQSKAKEAAENKVSLTPIGKLASKDILFKHPPGTGYVII